MGRAVKWTALECRIAAMAWLQSVDEYKNIKKEKIRYQDMNTLEFKDMLKNNVYELTKTHVYKGDIHENRYHNRPINAIFSYLNDTIFGDVRKFKKLLCKLLDDNNNKDIIKNFTDQEIINIAVAKHMKVVSAQLVYNNNNNDKNNNKDKEDTTNNNNDNEEDKDNYNNKDKEDTTNNNNNDNEKDKEDTTTTTTTTLDIEFRNYDPHKWKFYTAWLELCEHPKFAINKLKSNNNDDDDKQSKKKKKQKQTTNHNPSPLIDRSPTGGPTTTFATSANGANGVDNNDQNQQQQRTVAASTELGVVLPRESGRRRIFTEKLPPASLKDDNDISISSSDNDNNSSDDDDEDGINGEFADGLMDGPEDDIPTVLVLNGHRNLTLGDVSARVLQEQQKRNNKRKRQKLTTSSSSPGSIMSIDKLCTSIEESNKQRSHMIRLMELRIILKNRNYLPKHYVNQAEKELIQSTFE